MPNAKVSTTVVSELSISERDGNRPVVNQAMIFSLLEEKMAVLSESLVELEEQTEKTKQLILLSFQEKKKNGKRRGITQEEEGRMAGWLSQALQGVS